MYGPAEQVGLKDVNTVKRLLKMVLEGDELIYLDVWFDEGPDPRIQSVQDTIEEATGRRVSAPYVTQLKQRFLRKSFLQLLEHIDKITSLASLVGMLLETDRVHEKMFVLMMENIWAAFYAAEEIVRHSQTELSPELWAKWRTLTQRKKVQEAILVEAYRHYRLAIPLPRFCYLIELYSDTRFGGGVRRLFMDGDAEN
jgi:hypothetical protein